MNRVIIFLIPIYNWVSVISNYIIFAPKFFNFEIISALSVFDFLLPLRFSLLLFIVSHHANTLLKKSKMSQLLNLVHVIYGHGIKMVLDGFIAILSSTFCPKSTPILLPLFWLLKGKSQSPRPCLSMEALAWLASSIRLSPNRALLITRYFDPIVVAGNNRFSTLVRLVSADLSVSEMDICLRYF